MPHRLLLPPTFMLTSGGLMHFMVVKPLEAQLKQVIAEHNDSQTSKANAASENDKLRHKAGAVGHRGGWASDAGLLQPPDVGKWSSRRDGGPGRAIGSRTCSRVRLLFV